MPFRELKDFHKLTRSKPILAAAVTSMTVFIKHLLRQVFLHSHRLHTVRIFVINNLKLWRDLCLYRKRNSSECHFSETHMSHNQNTSRVATFQKKIMNKFILGILLRNNSRQGVWRQQFSLILGISLLAVSGSGQATVIGGSSSSNAVGVGVNAAVPLLGISANLSVNLIPASSGTAPTPYDVSNSVPSLNAGLGSIFGVGVGRINADASSNIDGSDGPKSASASASILDIGLDIGLGVLELVNLNLETVKSTATVSGDFGALVAAGETILEGAALSIAGVPIALVDIPAPNTVVDLSGLGLAGVSLLLNEQILTGDGVGSRGLAVNAIHLSFNAFVSKLVSLTGDIIIAHAQAQITAMPNEAAAPIPEPGTLALLGSGFAILGWKSRRKTAASFT